MISAWVDDELVPVEKLDVHKRGLKHRAVSVFLFHNGKTLLQQRAMEKYHTPGLWANACCTHPYWGEDPRITADRRLTEELGINGIQLSHRKTLEYRAEVGAGLIEHEVVDVFVGEMLAADAMSLNTAEVMNTQWITLPDLRQALIDAPQDFTPWLHIYIEQHADDILGDAVPSN